MNLKKSNRTIFIMLVCIGLVVVTIIANTLFLMSTGNHWRSGKNVNDFKDQISSASQSQEIQAKRGTIYDRTGAPIAEEITTYDIYLSTDKDRMGRDKEGQEIPAHVVDNVATAQALSPIIKKDADAILEILNNANANELKQVELGMEGKNLTSLQRDEILEHNLPGIGFTQSTTRNFPITPFSSNLIGYSSYDSETNALVGQMGLEASLNEYLQGTNGTYSFESAATGQEIPGTSKIEQPATDGNDVYLTLDQDVQVALEKALAHPMNNLSATKAWGIVTEVETGKILGWGSYPTFTQDTLMKYPSDDPNASIPFYQDPIAIDLYDPGSTMKVLTYAATMDSSNVNVYDAVFDSSPFYYLVTADGGAVRSDASNFDGRIADYAQSDKDNHGVISFAKGFYLSSNVGTSVLLTQYMSPATFANYIDAFGLGTAVDMFGVDSSAGLVAKQGDKWNAGGDYISTGFGQSISVTTLQMVQAFGSILNDGTMMQPYVVDKIVDSSSKELKYSSKPKVVGQPVTKETATQVKDLMKGVVEDPIGTANWRYRMEGVDMVAKTGTSEVWEKDEETGLMKLSPRVISSVVAGAPYDNPKVMVYLLFESTEYKTFDGDFFRELFQVSLEAANVGGNATHEPKGDGGLPYTTFEKYEMPGLMNHSLDYANTKLDGKSIDKVILGDGGQVVKQFPDAGEMIVSGQKVFLYTDGATMIMPNMIGWSRKDVSAFWNLTGIAVDMDGLGKVTSQDIAEGSVITSESVIKVKLE